MGLSDKKIRDMKARDIMSEVLVMLETDMDVSEAAGLFKRNRITGAPVVDEGGQVVGILSITDLMAQATGADIEAKKAAGHYHMSDLISVVPELQGPVNLKGVKVKELMETNFVSTASRTPVSSVATLMLQNKIRRVLIIDNRRLVGIVTQTDIIKAVAHEI